MTDPNTILPSSGGSGLLKVHGTSKLAFGATTAALVTLASGGTALLVAHGTGNVSSPTSLPGGLLTDTGSQAGDVIVDRPPGTLAPGAVDATEQALRDALARRSPTGRRILTVPLVRLGGATGVDLPGGAQGPSVPRVTPPVVKPPLVVTPPIVVPPIVVPPVVLPPVVTPPVVVPPVHDPHVPPPVLSPGPTDPPTTPPTTVPPEADGSDDHKDDDGNKHHGTDRHRDRHDGDHRHDGDDEHKRHASSRGQDVGDQRVIDLRDDESGKGKHVRSGRHAR